jgi:hypothetical protein
MNNKTDIKKLVRDALAKSNKDLGFVKETKVLEEVEKATSMDISPSEYMPSLKITKNWGMKGTTDSVALDKVLQKVVVDSPNTLERVKGTVKRINEILHTEPGKNLTMPVEETSSVVASATETVAALQVKNLFSSIIHDYDAQSTGLIMESFIARLAGGERSNDEDLIEDLYDGEGNPVSLKTVIEGSKDAVKGSLQNLASSIAARSKEVASEEGDPSTDTANGVTYLVCAKDREANPFGLSFYSFVINKGNFFNFMLGTSEKINVSHYPKIWEIVEKVWGHDLNTVATGAGVAALADKNYGSLDTQAISRMIESGAKVVLTPEKLQKYLTDVGHKNPYIAADSEEDEEDSKKSKGNLIDATTGIYALAHLAKELTGQEFDPETQIEDLRAVIAKYFSELTAKVKPYEDNPFMKNFLKPVLDFNDNLKKPGSKILVNTTWLENSRRALSNIDAEFAGSSSLIKKLAEPDNPEEAKDYNLVVALDKEKDPKKSQNLERQVNSMFTNRRSYYLKKLNDIAANIAPITKFFDMLLDFYKRPETERNSAITNQGKERASGNANVVQASEDRLGSFFLRNLIDFFFHGKSKFGSAERVDPNQDVRYKVTQNKGKDRKQSLQEGKAGAGQFSMSMKRSKEIAMATGANYDADYPKISVSMEFLYTSAQEHSRILQDILEPILKPAYMVRKTSAEYFSNDDITKLDDTILYLSELETNIVSHKKKFGSLSPSEITTQTQKTQVAENKQLTKDWIDAMFDDLLD